MTIKASQRAQDALSASAPLENLNQKAGRKGIESLPKVEGSATARMPLGFSSLEVKSSSKEQALSAMPWAKAESTVRQPAVLPRNNVRQDRLFPQAVKATERMLQGRKSDGPGSKMDESLGISATAGNVMQEGQKPVSSTGSNNKASSSKIAGQRVATALS